MSKLASGRWLCLAGGNSCIHCGDAIVIRDEGTLIFHAETGLASCSGKETVATPRSLAEAGESL